MVPGTQHDIFPEQLPVDDGSGELGKPLQTAFIMSERGLDELTIARLQTWENVTDSLRAAIIVLTVIDR